MTQTKTFSFTGAPQPFTVPAGVTSILVGCLGAACGSYNGAGRGGPPATGALSVTPGQVLWVYVGGQGKSGTSGSPAGGWNGGGTAGSGPAGPGTGGGGASDVRQGGQALSNRKIVSGGGGGRPFGVATGGQGGGLTGTPGTGAWAGNGGTQSAGGTIHASTGGGPTAGALGVGGHGGVNTVGGQHGGGGGGGGYYGGAGGGLQSGSGLNPSGGGGGSGYLGGVSGGAFGAAASGSTADGSVTFTFNVPPNVPTLTSPATNGAVDVTIAPTLQWQFSDPDPGDVQSSADVQYRAAGDSFTVVTAAAASDGTYTLPGPLLADTVYEWQVRTYDQSGAVSPWASSSFFTPRVPPSAPVAVSPPAGSAITADPAVYQWGPSGAQSAYELVLCADNAGSPDLTTVYSDAVVSSAAVSATVGFQGSGVTQGSVVHVRVRTYTYPGVWSPWLDWGAQTLNLNPPGQPKLRLIPDVSAAAIIVMVDNSDTPFPTMSTDLYRTDMTESGPEIRIQAGMDSDTTITDWTPASGHEYRYRAQAYSASGGITSSD